MLRSSKLVDVNDVVLIYSKRSGMYWNFNYVALPELHRFCDMSLHGWKND